MENERHENPLPDSDQDEKTWNSEGIAAFISKYRAEYDSVVGEAEWRDLLKQKERGELISIEDVLRDLGIDVEDEKETA